MWVETFPFYFLIYILKSIEKSKLWCQGWNAFFVRADCFVSEYFINSIEQMFFTVKHSTEKVFKSLNFFFSHILWKIFWKYSFWSLLLRLMGRSKIKFKNWWRGILTSKFHLRVSSQCILFISNFVLFIYTFLKL